MCHDLIDFLVVLCAGTLTGVYVFDEMSTVDSVMFGNEHVLLGSVVTCICAFCTGGLVLTYYKNVNLSLLYVSNVSPGEIYTSA